ncbi:hypothetical protein RSOLAG22IIIB_10294 [Rhizoctonia solani]|uniref:Transmembrane protein n=1 Tax=Rhizoctonia solani TaxID=456999 RepID=A0A0K6G2Q8_9AGAM|nr:unnamed protein product [Rhizoctonia solani]CUA72795.1 hypothetical protein RSOLAG22IIIB_10294 [Rhizoctonia solani]
MPPQTAAQQEPALPKPGLKDPTGHTYPNGHLWLYFTILLFVLALPALIIFNVITQGSELVPSLQPTFHPNNTNLEQWWGTSHLPERLRPGLPVCQPQGLGRGDVFRLSASMFDYTVMSTWNTSHSTAGKHAQEQERVEYHEESFSDCSVNTARYDYSLGDRTHSVTVGVSCPGTKNYSIAISMQTTMTFAWETSRDFIGQYYGPGIDLDLLDLTDKSNYRNTVLAVLNVISTDALTIFNKPLLPVPLLSMRVYFQGITEAAAQLPDNSTVVTVTYVNGSQPDLFPTEVGIYTNSVFNLVFVAIDAVNLDLGNQKAPNMFRNASRLREVVYANKAPPGINASNWALGTPSTYYGRITPPYETWADMLRNNQPANISVGNPTGLPEESAMVTTYLCPIYQIKPLKSLFSSVFIGSAAMTSTVWTGWLILVALLAKGQMTPRAKCECDECKANEKAEAEREAQGLIERYLPCCRRKKPARNGDVEGQPRVPYSPNRADSDQSGSSMKKE